MRRRNVATGGFSGAGQIPRSPADGGAGVCEGSPLASLKRRPRPKTASREASGRQG
jgi:hypothetical protein